MNSILGTFTAVVILSTAVFSTQNVQPQITQEVKNLTVVEEHIVSFVCKASGNPQPTFYWEKGGKKLNTRRNRFKVFDMPFGSVLRIETVKANDNDFFTCVAKNGVGEPVRSTGHLKVYGIDRKGNEFPQGYPNIIINPELKSVEKEKPTVMQCKADANGHKFEIEWFKNNVPVELGDNGRLTITRTGSLQIAKALESDYGRYECVASNEYGVAYSYAAMLYVRVRIVPPYFTIPPKREEVDPNGSVNLTCVAIGSPMPYVLWRDGANQLGEPVIGKNVLQLKNVTESKNYTCVASSNLGNIEHVGEIIVRALGTPPRYVIAKALNPRTVQVFWLPPEKPNGVIQGYRVFYTMQPNLPIILWHNQEVQSNTNSTIITNLSPNDTYTICVLAYSAKGEGPVSQLITVITNEGIPTPPRDLHASLLDTLQVHVTWKIPRELYGQLLGYQVIWGRKGESYQMLNLPSHRMSYISDVLEKGATYEFRVKAKNEVGLGERASAIIITPDGVPDGAPQNFSGDSLSKTSILLEWDLPAKHLQNGEIVMYQLLYRKLGSNIEEELNVTGLQYEVKGLDMNTDYIFRIRAFTSMGPGPWSAEYRHHTFGKNESNIEVIGSPTTVSILTELLIPSVQESGDQVPEEFCEQAQNDESLTTTEATEKPTSSTVTTATTCMESSMSRNVGNSGRRKRIRPEDVTQMQYAVLVEQQRKLREQTTFYMLMNKKLRQELEMPSED